MKKKARSARLDPGDDARKLRLQRLEYMQLLTQEGKKTRDFARREGLTAYKLKVFGDPTLPAREDILEALSKVTDTAVIDPQNDVKYEALKTASETQNWGFGRNARKIDYQTYIYWVDKGENERFASAVRDISRVDDWHSAALWVSVGYYDYKIEITQDTMMGTIGEPIGYLSGLRWAEGLNDGNGFDSAAAKATKEVVLQAKAQGITEDPNPLIKVIRTKTGRQERSGLDEYTY